MQALQGINTLIKMGQDSKMGAKQDQDYIYYAHLVAGLHGALSANARPIKQGQVMPILNTERSPLRPLCSTEDERLKNLAKELTGTQFDI